VNVGPIQVFEVRVRENRGVEHCRVGDVSVVPGDYVVTEHEGEFECADVVTEPFSLADVTEVENLLSVVRKATEADIRAMKHNQKLERNAFITARVKIRDRELPMNLVRVECTLDRKKLRFFFTADSRVDFRELVKDLAYIYKTRIEMRQIGVRDEARMIGGYSHCGREFCCVSYLRDFNPVTIRMAKEQNMALNPSKISGACGRLMCCLAYEYDFYKEARRLYPKAGTRLKYQDKEWVVTAFDVIKETVSLQGEGGPLDIPISDLKVKPAETAAEPDSAENDENDDFE